MDGVHSGSSARLVGGACRGGQGRQAHPGAGGGQQHRLRLDRMDHPRDETGGRQGERPGRPPGGGRQDEPREPAAHYDHPPGQGGGVAPRSPGQDLHRDTHRELRGAAPEDGAAPEPEAAGAEEHPAGGGRRLQGQGDRRGEDAPRLEVQAVPDRRLRRVRGHRVARPQPLDLPQRAVEHPGDRGFQALPRDRGRLRAQLHGQARGGYQGRGAVRGDAERPHEGHRHDLRAARQGRRVAAHRDGQGDRRQRGHRLQLDARRRRARQSAGQTPGQRGSPAGSGRRRKGAEPGRVRQPARQARRRPPWRRPGRGGRRADHPGVHRDPFPGRGSRRLRGASGLPQGRSLSTSALQTTLWKEREMTTQSGSTRTSTSGLKICALGALALLGLASAARATVSVTVRGSLALTEAGAFNGVVADVTDSRAATAGELTASIAWGDGATTVGTVAGSGPYTVSGMNHVYTDEGAFAVKVTVTDTVDQSVGSGTQNETVAEGDVLSGNPVAIAAARTQPFNGTVATFSDTDTNADPHDFTATILWGDASASLGSVVGVSGFFPVAGTHTYTRTGTFPVTVTLKEDGAGTATAQAMSNATVGPAPGACAATAT